MSLQVSTCDSDDTRMRCQTIASFPTLVLIEEEIQGTMWCLLANPPSLAIPPTSLRFRISSLCHLGSGFSPRPHDQATASLLPHLLLTNTSISHGARKLLQPSHGKGSTQSTQACAHFSPAGMEKPRSASSCMVHFPRINSQWLGLPLTMVP